jgi:hypothetical protein
MTLRSKSLRIAMEGRVRSGLSDEGSVKTWRLMDREIRPTLRTWTGVRGLVCGALRVYGGEKFALRHGMPAKGQQAFGIGGEGLRFGSGGTPHDKQCDADVELRDLGKHSGTIQASLLTEKKKGALWRVFCKIRSTLLKRPS